MRVSGTVNNQQAVCEAIWPLMASHRLDAWLVPSSDEHLNEYLPDAHKRREYLSGFSGSAGDAVVLSPDIERVPIWIFVDSRYYEQADLEVDPKWVAVSKLGLDGQPRLIDKLLLLGKSKVGCRIGYDPFTISTQMAQDFERQCQREGIAMIPVTPNLLDIAWGADRPAAKLETVYTLAESYTGQSVASKLDELSAQLKHSRCAFLPVTKLDQIAWLFNLRGQDVAYNPIFLAYALIFQDRAYLFCDDFRFAEDVRMSLPDCVTVKPYNDYVPFLTQVSSGVRVLIDPKHVTYGTFHTITQQKGIVVIADHPIENSKAVKNPTERHWMQEAHYKSAKGKIRAFCWLQQQLNAGQPVSEASFAQQLETFYALEEQFAGLSFNTIAGVAANSSIVHYGTPNKNAILREGELFLVDSGVQYLGGTTDDTRTIIIGEPSPLQRERFSEVLKAHINCASQIFPFGTEGARLDGITRATLWQHRMDYGHGTGHGVGAFLNVHEGPCGIHKLANKPLLPGMIVSIEPGYYQPGWGGIRCENLYLVVEHEEGNPDWLAFKPLTYIPFDNRLIDFSRLNQQQLKWLQQYHRDVLEKLSPKLAPDEAVWLQRACQFQVLT